MPSPKDVENFLAQLEGEGEEVVRENLMMVVYGEESNWMNKRARLFLARKDREREDDIHRKLDTNASTLLGVEEDGTKWSGWTAVFTGIIATFTGLLAVVALIQLLKSLDG